MFRRSCVFAVSVVSATFIVSFRQMAWKGVLLPAGMLMLGGACGVAGVAFVARSVVFHYNGGRVVAGQMLRFVWFIFALRVFGMRGEIWHWVLQWIAEQ